LRKQRISATAFLSCTLPGTLMPFTAIITF